MNRRKKLAGLYSFWRSKPEPTHFSTVCLEIRLSFEASFQVSYRDASGNLRIKRVRSNFWSTTFEQNQSQSIPLEFKVFVYSPNLQSNQELSMLIKLDEQIQVQKSFPVSMEKDYAGWFTLSQSEN